MSAQNPFDNLFDQITHLLTFVKENTAAIPEVINIPPDVEKRLEKLRKKIAKFDRLSADIVKMSGVSNEELKLRLQGLSKEVPPEGQRLIDRSHEIKKEAQNLNDKLEKELKYLPLSERDLSAKIEKPKDKKMDDKEYTKKRRSKFKRFGGNDKWKPL